MPDVAPFISRRQTLSLAGLATLGGVLVSPTMADDIVSIDQELTELRATYELTPLAVTVPALKGLHERALFLGHRRGHPAHRSALNAVTSRVGALRADALYNVGEVSLSRRISGHAASLGKLSGDPHTYANARRTQAAIEVYEGRPAFAMAYANQADERTPAGVACLASKARGAALAGIGADGCLPTRGRSSQRGVRPAGTRPRDAGGRGPPDLLTGRGRLQRDTGVRRGW